MLLSSTRKRKIHTGSLVYEKSDDWGQPAHINITLMIFQLKLNERLCYCVEELKVCVRHSLVGGYYYMLWIQRITRFVLCWGPNLSNPFN